MFSDYLLQKVSISPHKFKLYKYFCTQFFIKSFNLKYKFKVTPFCQNFNKNGYDYKWAWKKIHTERGKKKNDRTYLAVLHLIVTMKYINGLKHRTTKVNWTIP